jgi:uncharacterized protein (DUF736 family)
MNKIYILILSLLIVCIISYLIVQRRIKKIELLPIAKNDLKQATITEFRFISNNLYTGENKYIAQKLEKNKFPYEIFSKLIIDKEPIWADKNIKEIFEKNKKNNFTLVAYKIKEDIKGDFIPFINFNNSDRIIILDSEDKKQFETQIKTFQENYKKYLLKNEGYSKINFPQYVIAKI